nr:hypothetical protein BN993_03788 [Virgibacillus halodenitrificans]
MLLVTHQVNISALVGSVIGSGEMIVVRPTDDQLQVLGQLSVAVLGESPVGIQIVGGDAADMLLPRDHDQALATVAKANWCVNLANHGTGHCD